jgi:hypothetical protein
MVEDLIKRLKEATQAATPQNIDNSERIEIGIDGQKYIECPHCGGEGAVELEADYCNYDDAAIGVQFYGIGNEFGAAEAYFRAASPATILEIIDLIEQQSARLTALESERDALLAAAGKEAVKGEPVAYGCHVDLCDGDKPDGCVIDEGRPQDCVYASRLNDKQSCSFWRPIMLLYTAPTAALENGDGRDAWISVDERMPENDQIVAFVVKADQESPNWYLNGHVLGGTYHENWGFSTPGVGHRASHWMPLPAAPAALSQKAGEQQ